ncbi:N-acetyltransferase GCN5 [Klebsiella michiganensis]|uniref:N-acetyltransferase GCN5 n=1 Tax=Klebsiella michiganensis TaxID=1134687 RepID=A0A7H4MYG6_9ENTR|nr:N-acetyltransferase GCN5 [Klebsiella michiganensis]
MMILKDKEHVDSVDWLTVAEIIAAAGLNQRDVALVERAFRHSTFCWFGYENGQLIAVARAISDLTWCSYLADVAVHPRCQGKGYGQQLMQSVSDGCGRSAKPSSTRWWIKSAFIAALVLKR